MKGFQKMPLTCNHLSIYHKLNANNACKTSLLILGLFVFSCSINASSKKYAYFAFMKNDILVNNLFWFFP